MLNKHRVNAAIKIGWLLRLQAVRMYVPTVAVLMLGKPFNSLNQCQKRNVFEVYKANYGTCNKIPVYSYEQIKNLPNHLNDFLIDVRESSELKEYGKIPCSINIPLESVPVVLSPDFDGETFERIYGRKKPHKNSEIIFHCRSGRRSATAAETAIKLGYTNVRNYKGSWLDWAEREGLTK